MPTHVRRLLAEACVQLASAVDELEAEIGEFGEPIVAPLLDELVVTADLVRLGDRDAIELTAAHVMVDAALDREGLWADEAGLVALFLARTEIRRWVEVVQEQLESV